MIWKILLHILTKLKHNKIYITDKEVERSTSFLNTKNQERGNYEKENQCLPDDFGDTVSSDGRL